MKLAIRVFQGLVSVGVPDVRVVLVHVPEGAVVDWVDRHVGVVAPARVGRRLDAGAVDDRSFAKRHLSERIAGEAARVADAGEDGRAVHDAVAESHVALLVHRDASHPAMDAVARCIRALLVQAVRPADARLISYQRSPATPGAASTDWLVTSDS